MEIERSCSNLKRKYLKQWNELYKLYSMTYPLNNNMDDLNIIVCALNDSHSTNIFLFFTVANHIVDLEIDDCSLHKPLENPIYDNYVDKLLMALKRKDQFAKFKKDDLKNYDKFNNILLQFKDFYALADFNLKEIDIYLWQTGKEYFPNNFEEDMVI